MYNADPDYALGGELITIQPRTQVDLKVFFSKKIHKSTRLHIIIQEIQLILKLFLRVKLFLDCLQVSLYQVALALLIRSNAKLRKCYSKGN